MTGSKLTVISHNFCFSFLKQLMIDGGITELLFTSDNSGGLNKRFLSLPNGRSSILNVISFS